MLRKAIRRGWSDSLASLGGPPLAFTLLVIPLVGFVLHFAISGWAAMAPEFDVWSVYGVAATGLVLLLLFSYHVVCAPYRIERDRIAQLEADLARAEADLSANSARRPDLVIYIDNISCGRSLPGDDAVRLVLVSGFVANTGEMPSAAGGWSMSVYVDGSPIRADPYHSETPELAGLRKATSAFSGRSDLHPKIGGRPEGRRCNARIHGITRLGQRPAGGKPRAGGTRLLRRKGQAIGGPRGRHRVKQRAGELRTAPTAAGTEAPCRGRPPGTAGSKGCF